MKKLKPDKTEKKIVLSDTLKKEKTTKESNQKKGLVGKNWDKDLTPKQKDDLMRMVCQKLGIIDELGNIL